MVGRQQPEFNLIQINDTKLGVWHWPGGARDKHDAQQVLFVHATGFHSRVWDETVARLPGYDIWAFDMRGHGQSDKPEPPYHWKRFGADTAELAQLLNIRNAVGIGHSMGGHAAALAAALAPECFGALILIDPIIFPKSSYKSQAETVHGVLRRKNHWSSPGEMFESFKDRKPFDTWERKVLLDYCKFGLVIDPKGGSSLVLSCPPSVEASIYNQSIHKSADIYSEIAKISIPVELLMPGDPEPGVEPNLEQFFQLGHRTELKEQTHFIPMEVPGKVAESVRASVAKLDSSEIKVSG